LPFLPQRGRYHKCTVMRRLFLFSGLFVVLFGLSLVLNVEYQPNATRVVDAQAFRQTHLEKEQQLQEYLENFRDTIRQKGLEALQSDFYTRLNRLYQQEGLAFFLYNPHQLQYWSVNTIPLADPDTLNNEALYSLGNGWYYIRKMHCDSFRLVGAELIKKQYAYQNQYLKNRFQKDFDLPGEVSLVRDSTRGVAITGDDGNYLFSLFPSSYRQGKTLGFYVSVVLFLTALMFMFLALARGFDLIKPLPIKGLYLAGVLLFLVAARWAMLRFGFPQNLYHLNVFDPTFYASSQITPNLGDLLLHLLFIWFLLWMGMRHFKVNLPLQGASKVIRYGGALLGNLLTIGAFMLLYHLFYSLVFNSSFAFDFFRFFELKPTELLVLLTLFILFAIYFIWLDFFISHIKQLIKLKGFLLIFLPLSLLVLLMLFQMNTGVEWYVVAFFYLSHIGITLVVYTQTPYSYPRIMGIILLTALFSVYFIHHKTWEKERSKRQILVSNLEGERDRVGELLLKRREEPIARDTTISKWMVRHHENETQILEYLSTEYFSGFFDKYDLQISVCDQEDDLSVVMDNRTEQHHCYSFFDRMIGQEGIPLANSRFYYLDNLNGRISYIGVFRYHQDDSLNERTLYVSLDSRLTEKQLGYPELLLDKRLSGPGPLEDYSFAKYQYNQLIRRSGEYAYPMSLTNPFQIRRKDRFKTFDDYSHLIHHQDEETVIVISKPRWGFLDLLAQFSYLFAFFYLATLLFVFVSGLPENITRFNYNFKNKIKLSIILILILSLLAVGFGTVYYTSNQFRQQQKDNISEKLESVIVELEDKLGGEPVLTGDYQDYITHLLTKFSNVFYVDMNLYDLNGRLLASSRSQVFEKDLISTHMDPQAYYQLSAKQQPQYIHDEEIGQMSYHSAYVPFYNDRNEKLAYLNIPYFTRQKALQKEVYTIVMVMINIYVFLIILGTVVAVLVSNSITEPLRLIRQKLGHLGLDKPNEKIDYQSHDEIGELVSEYNRMLDELEENADKLAQSERETAWREMAKQIAHEIKNPLTPMKLKVQYLKRAWDDRVENFDQRMQQFADSMISQINTLSQIASEFSNFAKMPRARNERLDLRGAIDQTLALFENTENVQITKQNGNLPEAYVYADPDLFSRVLSNLVKNAIQAIPSQRQGKVAIGLEKRQKTAVMSISDNGSGIPERMEGKLFRPNFTTKSGGMGMGLAITRKIIEDIGGTITYQTQPGQGTTFFLELPLYQAEER